MIQKDLFSDNPISRKTDPISSHEAARMITDSGIRGKQQREVLKLVIDNPGRTSRELSASSIYDRYVVARRLPELEDAGLVKKGDIKKCWYSDKNAVIWWRIDK